MHAMLLAYESPGDFARRADKAAYKAYMDDWTAFGGALRQAGILKAGAALQGPETATVLSIKGGKRVVEDGPFADSREQLGGYFVVEVETIEEAAAWARKCPAAREGRVDVRVIPDAFAAEG